MNLSLAPRTIALLAAFTTLMACGGAQNVPPPGPSFDPNTQPIGLLEATSNASGLRLAPTEGAPAPATHTPIPISYPGPWPSGLSATAPMVAQVTLDGQNHAWVAYARGGGLVGAAAWDSVPKASRFPRPGVQQVTVTGDQVVARPSGGKLDALAGDRFVLVALTDGPLAQRLVGTARADTPESWRVTAGTASGELLAVRVASISKAMEAQNLAVIPELDPSCEGTLEIASWTEQLTAALDQASLTGVTVQPETSGTMPELKLAAICNNGALARVQVKGAREEAVMDTAFWSASALELDGRDLSVAIPLVAARCGELERALWLQSKRSGREATLLMAALALKAGWWTDVRALLSSDAAVASAPEARLFAAETAYRLGQLDRAAELLQTPLSDTTTSGCIVAQCQGIATSATRAMAWVLLGGGDAKAASDLLEKAIDNARTPEVAMTLLTHQAQLQIMSGQFDPERFRTRLATLAPQAKTLEPDPTPPSKPNRKPKRGPRGKQNPKGASPQPQPDPIPASATPKIRAAAWRYLALAALQSQGRPDAAMTCRSAQHYAQAGLWNDATDMWIACAEAHGVTGPHAERATQALDQAQNTALRAMDRRTLATAMVGRYLAFVERHATDRTAPEGASDLLQSTLDATYRADLFGQAGRVQRYALLMLPVEADINDRAKLLRNALNDALASIDAIETAFVLSLMGQLEAMRQRYQQAEEMLEAAVALANMAGEKQLAQEFMKELEAIQE